MTAISQDDIFPQFSGFTTADATYDGIFTKLIAPKNYKRLYVMLPGNGGTVASWKWVLEAVQSLDHEESAYLLVDLPNHGRSDRSDNPEKLPSQRAFIEPIQHAIQRAAGTPPAQVVLVGHCLGGMIAQLLSHMYQTYYTHLVLINTGSHIPQLLLPFRHPPFSWILSLTTRWWPADWYKKQDVLMPRKRYVNDIDLLRLWQDLNNVGIRYYAQLGMAIAAIPFDNLYTTLQSPTLVIGGDQDIYYPKNGTISFAKGFQCATLLRIEKGGHMAIFTNADEIARAIHTFLHS